MMNLPRLDLTNLHIHVLQKLSSFLTINNVNPQSYSNLIPQVLNIGIIY